MPTDINPQGATDLPDERDYKVEHILGAAPSDLPESVNLLNVPAKDQKKTMHCTAYGLTHVLEILNTIEHALQIQLDAEEQWKNQLTYPATAKEEVGDSLQSAIKSLKKFGLFTSKIKTEDGKLRIQSYGLSNKNPEELKGWLSKSLPFYTGCQTDQWAAAKTTGILNITGTGGGHAFVIVGYNKNGFIGLNSWGAKWGKFGNGTFIIPFDQSIKLFSCYLIYDEKEVTHLFKDVTSASWAYNAIKTCLENSIMNGYGEGAAIDRFFMPNQFVTRAELAQTAANLFWALKSS